MEILGFGFGERRDKWKNGRKSMDGGDKGKFMCHALWTCVWILWLIWLSCF